VGHPNRCEVTFRFRRFMVLAQNKTEWAEDPPAEEGFNKAAGE
jgi:hypothetical protein